MKHIFTIHSHLTFLTAYSTILHLNIPDSDVILLTSKYKVPVKRFRIEPSYQMQYASPVKKLLAFNVPKSHDKMINRMTGEDDFIAYVDLMSYYQKILITHEKCRGFHFIEEGNGAYQEYDDMQDITWAERNSDFRTKGILDLNFRRTVVRALRGYNLKLLSIPYAYMAYVNFEHLRFFCFSNNSYYNAPQHKKIIVRPDARDPNLVQMAKNVVLENEVIWIDGSNGRYTGLPEKIYYDAIDKSIDKLLNTNIINLKVHVKLRSNKKSNEIYLVSALKARSIEVILLPDDAVLEALFLVSNKCTVIGTLSAALEYAHCFGHRSMSIYSMFSEKRTTFLDRMKGFWENVELV
jgi:hypothetical protein